MRTVVAFSVLLLASLLLGAAPVSPSHEDQRRSVAPVFPVALPATTPAPATPAPAPARFDVTLATFETRYQQRMTDRAANLALAAAHLDGVVIPAGGELSFDATVGPRLEATGFRRAPVLANGEHHLGVGGGVCQVATTLHVAALYAGLDVLQQHVHSIPSVYVDPGLDARIAEGTSDLRLRNPTATPVLIRARADHGVVHVELLGATAAPHVTISMETEVLAAHTSSTVDATLPAGAQVVDAEGHDGLRVRRTRTVGTRIEVRTLVYPAADRVVRIGPQTA